MEILQLGIYTILSQMGNTSVIVERQIGTAGRVSVFVKVDENGCVSGGGRVGRDIGPHAHASVGVDIDSKQNVSTSWKL